METVSQDRRSGRTLRVPFEALVIISGQSGNVGAYECEATDVSEQGMHLRTAYLPDLGQSLTCRFETGIDEVVAEGTVVWRQEAARGGEFGVQFTKLDARSIAALRELCGTLEPPSPSEVAAAPPPAPAKEEIPASKVAAPASREVRPGAVRLHLEGVSAPMSAQVRTTSNGEVLPWARTSRRSRWVTPSRSKMIKSVVGTQ
ncbi:MAG: PilZ domain-containing protein [Polyangiaceae bacterium]